MGGILLTFRSCSSVTFPGGRITGVPHSLLQHFFAQFPAHNNNSILYSSLHTTTTYCTVPCTQQQHTVQFPAHNNNILYSSLHTTTTYVVSGRTRKVSTRPCSFPEHTCIARKQLVLPFWCFFTYIYVAYFYSNKICVLIHAMLKTHVLHFIN